MREPVDAWVAATVAAFRTDGYRGDFTIETGTIPPSLLCLSCHRYLLARTVTVHAMRSFGCAPYDPVEAVAFALTCPRCGTAGSLLGVRSAVTALEESEVLAELEDRARAAAASRRPGASEAGAGAAD